MLKENLLPLPVAEFEENTSEDPVGAAVPEVPILMAFENLSLDDIPTNFGETDGMRPRTSGSSSASGYSSTNEEEDMPKKSLAHVKELIAGLWVSKVGWDLEIQVGEYSFQTHVAILTGSMYNKLGLG